VERKLAEEGERAEAKSRRTVTIWSDQVTAIDEGNEVGQHPPHQKQRWQRRQQHVKRDHLLLGVLGVLVLRQRHGSPSTSVDRSAW